MNILTCPQCGDTGDMHHGVISIFERPKSEDGDGIKLTVRGTAPVKTETVPEKEMPGRRNALIINFECWICKHQSQLRIQQHKGATLLEWLDSPDASVILHDAF